MKIKILTILLGLTLVVNFTGCSNKDDAKQTENTQKSSNGIGSFIKKLSSARERGEVSEIIGNEVTMKLLKTPEIPENIRQSDVKPGSGQGIRDRESLIKSMGGTVGLFKQGEYTGETKTVIIPVGVKITTIAMGENGIEEIETDMNAIKTGSNLLIFYSEDSENIENVLIIPTGGAMKR